MGFQASNYNGGPIKVMVGQSSADTLGSGGSLLNHNFKTLYDLIAPSEGSGGTLVSVPIVSSGSSSTHKALTFALPTTSGLTSGSDYVAVYTSNGGVTWKKHTTESGETAEVINAAPSELVRSEASGYQLATATSYFDGSNIIWTWTSNSMRTIPQFQKTYKKIVTGPNADVVMPSFGSFFVTGTLVFVSDAQGYDTPAYSHLVRCYIYGHDTSVRTRVFEVCSNGYWMTTSSQITTSTPGNNVLRIHEPNATNINNVIMDLTVIGGRALHEYTSGNVIGSGFTSGGGAAGLYFTSAAI